VVKTRAPNLYADGSRFTHMLVCGSVMEKLRVAAKISVSALLVIACADSDKQPRQVLMKDSGIHAIDATASRDSSATPDAASDSGVHNWMMIGSYRCCLPGDGKTCCDGVRNNLCYEYGGYRGKCVNEGDGFDGKDSCALCCPGLTRGSIACVGSPNFVASGFVCVRCGDGTCGAAEDECNCPADCKKSGAARVDASDADD
jgi:hypothetical protein